MIIESKVDADKATHAYMALLDALEPFTPAETMVAALTFVGVQWDRSLLKDDQAMRAFIKNMSDWLAAYSVRGEQH